MTKNARDIYWIILVAVLVNALLWLDSFERYLNGRYHVYLSEYVPEVAFTPSRVIRQALATEDSHNQPVSTVSSAPPIKVAPSEPIALIPQPTAPTLPASLSADKPIVLTKTDEQQAVAPTAETALQQTQLQPNVEEDEDLDQPASTADDTMPKVLFAGDSMMQGIAPMVISSMRKDYPKGVFIDASKHSTGLAARQYFDWPAKIKEESIKHGIQVIVIFLGPNDPWDIFEGKKRYVFPSEGWEEKYRSRVDDVLDFAASSGIRVIWIGLPVMRDERVMQGAKIENRIFQEEAQKYKFDYLPTEDFLGSLDAPYTKYIEDPKKGKLAVRLNDGVHFTYLGLRMISSRVDAQIRKQEKL